MGPLAHHARSLVPMAPSRLWSLLLVPGGLAAGHALGYRAALVLGSDPAVAGGHGYLQGMLCLAVPFTLAVLGRALLAGTRSQVSPVRFGSLATAQVMLFLAIEVAEHAAAGVPPSVSLRETTTVLGLAAQVVVAWLIGRVMRSVTAAAERVAAATRDLPRPRAIPRRPRTHARVTPCVATPSLSRRGPPVVRAV